MKPICLLSTALLVAACSFSPDIDDLKEDSYPLAEQLLTEDDNDFVTHRLDRYILDGHPDKLTYTGTIKVTEFTKHTSEDGSVQLDSTKYYRDVVITFRGTDYDKYTLTFYED
ncbi:MAG: hypothetical protein IJL91_01885 [Bacteroidales bacterium]|nr:hypothetical protein [Bacteroidales bacterium]